MTLHQYGEDLRFYSRFSHGAISKSNLIGMKDVVVSELKACTMNRIMFIHGCLQNVPKKHGPKS